MKRIILLVVTAIMILNCSMSVCAEETSGFKCNVCKEQATFRIGQWIEKRIADKNERLPSPMFDMGTMPYIEMLGNRRITVEGSTGILLYDSESIKINTCKTVISFCGRGMTLKCISSSCVEIEGFVTDINFLS